VDVSRHKADFLHAHNKRRNFLALGKVPGYYPAARMATMVGTQAGKHVMALTCDIPNP